MRNHYSILGVPQDADKDSLKRAYRKAALKHHPDRNPDNKAAEDAFKEAGRAYTVLNDDEMRRAYDATLSRPSGCHSVALSDYDRLRKAGLSEFGAWMFYLGDLKNSMRGP